MKLQYNLYTVSVSWAYKVSVSEVNSASNLSEGRGWLLWQWYVTFHSSDENVILMHDHKKIKFVTRKEETEIPVWLCAADIEGMKAGEAVQTVSFWNAN